jgi:hypothetical protein
MPSSVGTTAFSTSMSTVVLPAWPVLARGANNLWPLVIVRSLQYLLNVHGAGLAVDGLFGAKTDAAVRAFQRAHGLVVDGVVGQQTWSAVIVTVRRGAPARPSRRCRIRPTSATGVETAH